MAEQLLNLYFVVLIVYAVISWVPSLQGSWTNFIARLVEPVLAPVRQIIPPVGGLDLAFLVVIIAVRWIAGLLPRTFCAFG